VFLDESTNAMDAPAEEKVFASLRAQAITVVSTGHRDSLLRHHATVIDLGRSSASGSDGHDN